MSRREPSRLPYAPRTEVVIHIILQGNSRVYTLAYPATDRAGNMTTQSVTVAVPRNR